MNDEWASPTKCTLISNLCVKPGFMCENPSTKLEYTSREFGSVFLIEFIHSLLMEGFLLSKTLKKMVIPLGDLLSVHFVVCRFALTLSTKRMATHLKVVASPCVKTVT
jgi:hypothetical protein